MKIVTWLALKHRSVLRWLYRITLHVRCKNKRISIIANDCTGGLVYNLFGLRFLSPTINAYIPKTYFLSFCKNLEQYLDAPLVQSATLWEGRSPMGLLIPKSSSLSAVQIAFVHSESFSQAKKDWNRRVMRINWGDIRIIYSMSREDEIFTETETQLWNSLTYKKVLLIADDFANALVAKGIQLPSCSQIIYCDGDKYNARFFAGVSKGFAEKLGKKRFQQFDWLRWINKTDASQQ